VANFSFDLGLTSAPTLPHLPNNAQPAAANAAFAEFEPSELTGQMKPVRVIKSASYQHSR
jgi:hypothetical protein